MSFIVQLALLYNFFHFNYGCLIVGMSVVQHCVDLGYALGHFLNCFSLLDVVQLWPIIFMLWVTLPQVLSPTSLAFMWSFTKIVDLFSCGLVYLTFILRIKSLLGPVMIYRVKTSLLFIACDLHLFLCPFPLYLRPFLAFHSILDSSVHFNYS